MHMQAMMMKIEVSVKWWKKYCCSWWKKDGEVGEKEDVRSISSEIMVKERRCLYARESK